VVTEALRERLSRFAKARKRDTVATELLAIGRRCAATVKRKTVDHAVFLYDEHGLPK